jgi:hypothetical protein
MFKLCTVRNYQCYMEVSLLCAPPPSPFPPPGLSLRPGSKSAHSLLQLLGSLPRLQPSLESLSLHLPASMKELPPEVSGLSALTGLMCFSFKGKADPLPALTTLSSLRTLALETPHETLVTSDWSLPLLTALSVNLLAPASLDLPAALPALRELDCQFALAPDDAPPLSPGLTSLTMCFTGLNFEQDPLPWTADRVLRWTDASPLSACPDLRHLEVTVEVDCVDDEDAACTVVVPTGLAGQLQKLKVEVTADDPWNDAYGWRSIIRAPASLRDRLTAPGALELEAQTVEWV